MGGIGSGRLPAFETPEQLDKLCNKYFEKTDKEFLPVYHKQLTRDGSELVEMPIRRPYTIEGLCLFLGISRVSLLNYEKSPEFTDVVQYHKQRITLDQIERALIGENNAQFTKFNLINNSSYKDEKSIDHTTGGEKITRMIID